MEMKNTIDFRGLDPLYHSLEVPVFLDFDEDICSMIEEKVYLFLRQFFDEIEFKSGELMCNGIANVTVSHFRPHFSKKCKNSCRDPKTVLSLICDLFSANILYHNQLRMWFAGEDVEKSVPGHRVFTLCCQVDPADLEPRDYEKKH